MFVKNCKIMRILLTKNIIICFSIVLLSKEWFKLKGVFYDD